MEILFCGDISVRDSAQLFAEERAEELFSDVIPLFRAADRVIVNLECAVTEHDRGIEKFGPCLKAPFGTVETLKRVGVTDCALANNHIFDFGKKGLFDTLASLEKNGIGYTGIGENKDDARRDMEILTPEGKRIRVINVCEHEYSYALYDRVGARELCPFETADDVARAKGEADYVVLIIHGGKEHCTYPSERLVRTCRSMVRRGADLVLCQHTHCISCYEEFEGAHILYGQGNFHFVWNEFSAERPYWNEGLIVRADFGERLTVSLIPTVVEGLGIRLADDAEKERLLSELSARSLSLLDGSWRDRFAEYCRTQEQYRMFERLLPPFENAILGHFLDCEAHTDVLRELYKTANHTNEKD